MKKFFFVAAIAIVSLFCISANAESTETSPVENYVSSVTATIAGMDGEIDFETGKLVLAYNLMPQKVKDLCVDSYRNVSDRIEKNGSRSFKYAGVLITPIKTADGTDIRFSYQGHTIVIKNYIKAEFDSIFGGM